ncbi:PREDICTED: cysteine-rich receptor-like protein kinase 1 [Populus euphratica]|uniref:Cysteine-rich receptor-like protein kinase 1 n=1 Tax=Populus euphratica TaxID=75702 RepID=A0AAJ6Y390_POPEU|nr:PREDICTED: cysteine-rich receptor-like protein kinase 1 [Populus euphratica]
MDSLQKQVGSRNWGCDFITSPLLQIYGLAQCHDDLSSLDCKICFFQGRVKLPRCLPATSARIYLNGCFIRYDKYNFFHEAIDPMNDAVVCGEPTNALTDNFLHMEFKQRLAVAIQNVTAMALGNGKFAAAEAKGRIFSIYALAQCWNTLDKDECRKCLVKAGSKLSQCAPGSEGSAFFAGCYMKYSTHHFFKESVESKARYDNTGIVVAVTLSTVVFVVLASFGAFIGYERLSKRKGDKTNLRLSPNSSLNFTYEVLEKATEYFDDSRKLGQGGAGSVFKGTLPDGRTVAVKRLVYSTRQWVDQFFNEVNLISGIQHKNLVILLGCSIEGPESLLVYEYVPNRSLDQILFIKNTLHILNWQQRFNIILGTARGLAYLHGGCGVTIIHRDIKTSNILLDEKLTPKIADFGLARCVATDNTHISTGIAGTLGYMAPEYLVRGQLTEKVDVYGFGVLLLEIATGKKNSVFSQGSSSILHSVWKHYKANTITDMVDPGLRGMFSQKQAEKVLQIGLLCTQASSRLRPSMNGVVQMLTDAQCQIPSPKQPPFLNASVLSPDGNADSCITEVSLTCNSVVNQQTTSHVTLLGDPSKFRRYR